MEISIIIGCVALSYLMGSGAALALECRNHHHKPIEMTDFLLTVSPVGAIVGWALILGMI